MKKLLFITWSISYGYGTEKSLADVINRMDKEIYNISILDAFEKHSYVPPIFMHVNLCSHADNTAQLVPFLKEAEHMKDVKEYHNIKVILHFSPEKGHDGIDMNEAIQFLYRILEC